MRLNKYVRPFLRAAALVAQIVVGSGIPVLTLPVSGAFGGASTLLLKAGDFGEYLTVQITDANGPVDVSGASGITLRVRGLYESVAAINGAAGVTTNQTGGVRNEIAYRLQAGDTLLAGDYAVEVCLVWSNGQARTSNALRVTILADVG